ncbi:Insulin-Like Growth Factor 2 Mrna-Binding Protein 1 [Manis pentadactyla]|nr:Insulin-Like Growth Factor 2 Mrna-Binding Protein 1 [Manis pentadactyla]
MTGGGEVIIGSKIGGKETTPYGCSGACQFDLEAQHTAVVLKSPSPCLSWPSEYLAQPALFVYVRGSVASDFKRPHQKIQRWRYLTVQELMELRMISRVWNMTEMIVDELLSVMDALGAPEIQLYVEEEVPMLKERPEFFPLRILIESAAAETSGVHSKTYSTYWNQGYGYQQGYGPGYGGSDDSPHGYYGYGPGYYYRTLAGTDFMSERVSDSVALSNDRKTQVLLIDTMLSPRLAVIPTSHYKGGSRRPFSLLKLKKVAPLR